MQELRFIGADDGALIVSDEGGSQYRVLIDDALRDALRPRPHVRSEAPKVAPREIQQLIRAGRTAEQVVELTGADPEDVARFEGPVMAEREHIVEQARLVAVRVHPDLDPLDAEPATFGEALDERLESLAASSVRWDAWKDPEAGWRLGLEFVVDEIDRDAVWSFDPRSHALAPLNPSAVTLSQQGELSSLQAPRLRAVNTPLGETEPAERLPRPDHEAASTDASPEAGDAPSDGPGPDAEQGAPRSRPGNGPGAGAPLPPRASDPRGAGWVGAAVADIGRGRPEAPRDETADLLEQLRRRRGERELQTFDDFDDEVDLDDDDASLAARQPASTDAGRHEDEDGAEDARPSTVTPFAGRTKRDRGGDEARTETGPARGGAGAPSASSTRVQAVDVPLAGLETEDDHASASGDRDAPGRDDRPSLAPIGGRGATGPLGKRRGRASMPSWDEIVFGTRSDDDRD